MKSRGKLLVCAIPDSVIRHPGDGCQIGYHAYGLTTGDTWDLRG